MTVRETEMEVCRWCNGKGTVPAHWWGARKRCPECNGEGRSRGRIRRPDR